ncbi:hypothetical protein OOK60_09190 [Trichothermofontia sichuanensis B231]|nr:hypothetical protein [Trichothermofontia sichuanensis]UZQ56202.1 hypothetical protein OOK60_09190 [Trichothermofontia sichuanensis B231]
MDRGSRAGDRQSRRLFCVEFAIAGNLAVYAVSEPTYAVVCPAFSLPV